MPKEPAATVNPGGPGDPPPPGGTNCGQDPVVEDFNGIHFYDEVFWLPEGSQLRAATSDFHPAQLWPFPDFHADSVMYLLACADADCESGEVLATGDDTNFVTPCTQADPNACFDSAISVNIPFTGFYRLVSFAWDGGSMGLATVRAWRKLSTSDCILSCGPDTAGGSPIPNCTPTCPLIEDADEQLLGGYSTTDLMLRPRDALMVGARPPFGNPSLSAADREYHDSKMLALSHPDGDCIASPEASCGKFRYNDDVKFGPTSALLLSKIEFGPDDEDPTIAELTDPPQQWNGRVVVGAFRQWNHLTTDASQEGPPPEDAGHVTMAHFRLMVHHAHADQRVGASWWCNEKRDWDGDGLSWELEEQLGSCDTVDQHPATVGIGVGAPNSGVGFGCRDFASLISAGIADLGDSPSDFNQVRLHSGYTPSVHLPHCPPLPNPTSDPFANADWQPESGQNLPPNDPNHLQYCWHADDSDNDGLKDAWEVWGVGFWCTATPSAPYFDAGVCTPFPTHTDPSSNPFAAAIAEQNFCTAEPLSARSGVAPDIFDVLVDTAYTACTTPGMCSKGSPSQPVHDHRYLTEPGESQGETMSKIFTDHPQTCWDGSSPPCIDAERDIPYRAALHWYNSVIIDRADDATVDELEYSSQQYCNMIKGPRRWAHLTHHFIANHPSDGDAATGGLHTEMSNGDQSSYDSAAAIHELGHGLGLHHSVAPGPAQNNSTCVNQRTWLDGCDPSTGAGIGSQAIGFPTGGTSSSTVVPHRSIMGLSYDHGGVLAKSAALPPQQINNPTCNAENDGFSKGLNQAINEQGVKEWQDGSADVDGKFGAWRAIKLARELNCYNAVEKIQCPANPFGYGFGNAPQCSQMGCSFDWNGDDVNQGSNVVYPWDVSHGNTYAGQDNDNVMCLAGPPTATQPVDECRCEDDVLRDVNEWRRLVTLGRWALGQDHASFRDVAVYMDSFNSGGVHNDANWSQADLPVTAQGDFSNQVAPGSTDFDVHYPVNRCAAGAACSFECEDGADCISGTCEPTPSGTRCQCATDDECPGNYCDGAHCSEQLGWLTCSTQPECFPLLCTVYGYCMSSTPSSGPVGMGRPPSNSMRFGGSGAMDFLRLQHTGTHSPIRAIEDSGQLQVRFDLRIDMHPGDGPAWLFRWGSLALTAEGPPDDLTLRVTAGAFQFEFQGTRPVRGGLWHRITLWVYEGMGGVALQLATLSPMTNKWIENPECMWSMGAVAFQPTQDLWFGSAGTSAPLSAAPLRGRMDNISVFSYPHTNPPFTTCQEANP